MFKKGCLLVLFIVVFAVGIGYYLIDKYGFEFLSKSKDEIVEEAMTEIKDQIVENLEDKFRREFDQSMNNFKDKLESMGSDEILEQVSILILDIKSMLKDGTLDDFEYRKLINRLNE